MITLTSRLIRLYLNRSKQDVRAICDRKINVRLPITCGIQMNEDNSPSVSKQAGGFEMTVGVRNA